MKSKLTLVLVSVICCSTSLGKDSVIDTYYYGISIGELDKKSLEKVNAIFGSLKSSINNLCLADGSKKVEIRLDNDQRHNFVRVLDVSISTLENCENCILSESKLPDFGEISLGMYLPQIAGIFSGSEFGIRSAGASLINYRARIVADPKCHLVEDEYEGDYNVYGSTINQIDYQFKTGKRTVVEKITKSLGYDFIKVNDGKCPAI